jgi:hypothetical protein
VEEYRFRLGRRYRGEGVVKSLFGRGDLLVDELAADLGFVRQIREGTGSDERLQSKVLTLVGAEGLRRTAWRGGGRSRGRWGARMKAHVCFLRKLGSDLLPA